MTKTQIGEPTGAQRLTRANLDAIRDHLFDHIHKNGEQLKNDLPNILRRAIKAEIWKEYADATGKPFDNLVDWLHYTFPNGTSMGQGQHALTYYDLIKLTEGASDVQRLLKNAGKPIPGPANGQTESHAGPARTITLQVPLDRIEPAANPRKNFDEVKLQELAASRSPGAADPKIKAIAPWFGSKRRLAPRIIQQLGPHTCYWEPFCGSMAVLLAKPEVSQETVNDLHGDLILLALVIQHPKWGPWLYRKLHRTLVHQEMRKISKAQLANPHKHHNWDGTRWQPLWTDPDRLDEADAKRAYWFFYNSWLGRNGVIGTAEYNNNFCTCYTRDGGIQGVRFASAVDSIPGWRRRLREVTILNKDGFDLLEKIEDQAGVAIYVDPPYLQKGASYLHDFAAADHVRLAEGLARFRRARVVVSYYDDPRLSQLYQAPWKRIDCPISKSLSVQGKRGSTNQQAPELLLVNGPAFAEQNGSLF